MGRIVEKQVRLSMVSITDISKSLNVNRRTLYNWFTRPRIPEAVVLNIGDCIGYDFSVQIPGLDSSDIIRNKKDIFEGTSLSIDDDFYKMKYLHLLEKYNQMLEDIRLYRFST
ncbi:hypothetical protein [Pararcticibacter amylolyticus]|nr:hypothetical protein [Pararcticibacter amylolyticus]